MSRRRVAIGHESWPIRGRFTISRGSKTTAEVVVVEISEGDVSGRGECVPYPHYGESVAGVVAAIEALVPALADGLDREELQTRLPAGAARNAVDCALWDLAAKRSGEPAWRLAGLPEPVTLETAYTISLDTPAAMAAAAAAVPDRRLLKLKLGGAGDVERVAAVRAAAPQARLIADANEAWDEAMLADFGPRLADLGVAMIEQPLPAGRDAALAGLPHPVPLCADESCRQAADLATLAGRYELINVKLDKTGGLTGALALVDAAERAGFGIFLGCMVATSLAMAPAALLGPRARFVDLDGPLLLDRDREPGIRYDGSMMQPPPRALWG